MGAPDAGDAMVALQRYFLLSYRQEAQARFPVAWELLPLAVGSRLDLVAVNGGHSLHFFYRFSDGREDVTHIHDVTVAGATAGGVAAERAFLEPQYAPRGLVRHFALAPPFHERFDEVAREARAAVAAHGRELAARG